MYKILLLKVINVHRQSNALETAFKVKNKYDSLRSRFTLQQNFNTNQIFCHTHGHWTEGEKSFLLNSSTDFEMLWIVTSLVCDIYLKSLQMVLHYQESLNEISRFSLNLNG